MGDTGEHTALAGLRASVQLTERERVILAALARAERAGEAVPPLSVLSAEAGISAANGAQYPLDRLSHKRLTEGERGERRLTAAGWAVVGEVAP